MLANLDAPSACTALRRVFDRPHFCNAPHRRIWRLPLRSTLAAVAAATLLPAPVHAQSHSPTASEVVIVTGARDGLPPERIVGDVVVIDGDTLRNAGADSLEALLQREAGLQLSRTGGPGQSAGLLIRGSAATNTLVLVDGVRIGSATLGQTALNGLSLIDIERIEVLRGPASSLYGADALGGVVQIITRRGRGPAALNGRIALGQRGSAEGALGVQGSTGALDYALGASAERSDGVSALRPGDLFGNYNPDADGFERRSLQVNLGYTPAPGHRIGLLAQASRLDAQYDASQFLPPDFAQDASPDFRNDSHTRLWALDHRGTWSPQFSTQARASKQVDDLASGAAAVDRFRTERSQVDAQATWRFTKSQQLTAAVERLDEDATSTSYLGTATRRNTAGVLAYAGDFRHAGAADRFGNHSVQADVRVDDNSVYGGVTTGRLGASLALGGGWRVRALTGTSFRAPSFNELVFPGYGVPTLQPERGRSVELGLDWRQVHAQSESQAAATLYRNRVRQLIAYEGDAAGCPADPQYAFGCASNLNRARLQGLSLSAAHRVGAWALRAGLELLDAEDEATGTRLNRRAAQQASAGVDYSAGDWRLGAALLRVGSRPDGGATLQADTTLDLTAAWRFAPKWQLEARLLNATDADTEPVRDYRGAPRQAWIGLRFDGLGL